MGKKLKSKCCKKYKKSDFCKRCPVKAARKEAKKRDSSSVGGVERY